MRNFAETVHPLGGSWYCGTCGVKMQAGHCCPDCGNVLCDTCVDRVHHIPAGARKGTRCRNSAAETAEPGPGPEQAALT